MGKHIAENRKKYRQKKREEKRRKKQKLKKNITYHNIIVAMPHPVRTSHHLHHLQDLPCHHH